MESGQEHTNKTQHNVVFATWLISHFGQDYLRKGTVFDIAGGLGLLSFHLSVRYGVCSTLIEPRPIKLKGIHRRRMRKLHKARKDQDFSDRPILVQRIDHSPLMKLINSTMLTKDDGLIEKQVEIAIRDKDETVLPFSHVKSRFLFPRGVETGGNSDQAKEKIAMIELLSDASILLGMHSDGATEAIIDAALELDKPFAVVPCCVFPRENPDRVLPDGEQVVTYEHLLTYLQAKAHDASILKAELPFFGRNVVLYRLPKLATDRI